MTDFFQITPDLPKIPILIGLKTLPFVTVEIITTQIGWTSNTISELYKICWQIEIFFSEIKQLLHIKTFIGTTEKS